MFFGAFNNLNCYLLHLESFGGIPYFVATCGKLHLESFGGIPNSCRNSLVGFLILLQLVVSFRTWLIVEAFGEFLNIYFQYYTETFGGFP